MLYSVANVWGQRCCASCFPCGLLPTIVMGISAGMEIIKRNIFWIVLTALVAGCSGGLGEHDGEDGRTSATPVANHNSVAPGTCNTCHNGTAAKGKNSGHISTTASCDTCHRTTGWEPATMGHSNVAQGTCVTCHNGTMAGGKSSNHIATTASCDTCHLTTGWKPATMGHSNVAQGTCATCHNGTTARGKSSTHISTTDSCDTCHQTAAWIPATTGNTSTIDFPVEAVFTTLASIASTYSASATDAAGNGFLLSVVRLPGPEKTDPLIYALPLKTYTQSNTLRKNGNIASTKNIEEFYSTAPLYLFGNLNNIGGSSNVMKVTTQLPLPSISRVGASGVIYRGRNYINSSTAVFDTWYAMWSLETDSATTAWLCLNIAVTPASGAAGSTAETDCFRIDQAGNISGFKSDITENGITLSYR